MTTQNELVQATIRNILTTHATNHLVDDGEGDNHFWHAVCDGCGVSIAPGQHVHQAALIWEQIKPRTIGYIVVGKQNNALDWDDRMYETVDSAIASLCGPYQPSDRDPESPNYWGKEYRICPVSELEAHK